MTASVMTSFKTSQSGGTMLGLVIGALVGLGAALAVAVYVTKVPVPFLNKAPTRAADSDAAEAAKNKGWNPNAPLAGKAPPPVAAPAPAPAASGAGDVAVPEPTIAKPKTSSDPLGDLAKAKAEAKAAAKLEAKPDIKPDAKPVPRPESTSVSGSAESGIDPFNYFVQAGAFRTPEDAEQQRARLLLMGFQAKVTEREQAGRTVYRVRLGPFDKKDDADRTKEKLDGNSIETAMVRVQR
jgi:cell division protein FtsN